MGPISLITGILGLFLGTIPGFLITTIAALLVFWYKSKPSGIPPGPIGVPALGFLPYMYGRDLPVVLEDLKKKYGNVASIYFGEQLAVVINDYDTIRKAFVDQSDIFSGRVKEGRVNHINTLFKKDILTADGPHWRENRRFALSTLRDYGVGKSNIESAILDEISNFLSELEKFKNQDIDPSELLGLSVCNNVVILVLGKRMEYTDPDFIRLKQLMDGIISQTGNDSFLDIFLPWLRKIPGVDSMVLQTHKARQMHDESNVMMKKHIKNHQKEYNEGDSNDYLNAFLSEQKTRKKNKNFAEFFDDDTLIANMKIMFVAGMETTTNTLRWALVYLMIHPDIQRKVQKEIDDVIGPNRMPSYEDRPRMPYTEAVLLEVQRCASVVPLSVIHRATDNAVLNGYKIPKDTLVLPNLYAVHHDEKLYPDPNSFRPERFINEQGQVIKPDWLIPFSVGKRFCLGEPLARMELFLYFTCMFQRFTFQKPEDYTLSLKPIVTVVRNVGDFKSHILVRNK